MVCYLTLFKANIVSITIFDIFAANISDLDLGRFKLIKDKTLVVPFWSYFTHIDPIIVSVTV